MNETLNFIDGRFVPAASGRLFDNRCPVDNRLVSRVHEAGRPEVDAAVAAARAALHGPWAKLGVQERAGLLYEIADEINRRFDEFLDAEIADTGKPASLARHIDIPRGAANFAFLGQFTEIPEDVVFTVEYSVRGAMHAVYGLLGLDHEIPGIYHALSDPKTAFGVLKAALG